MAENSNIEWTDHTFNPWRGCTKVSPGCENCYAETLSLRNPAVLGQWGRGKPRVLASEDMWKQPVKWNAAAGAARHETEWSSDDFTALPPPRPRVFCASLADWLDDEVPIHWLIRLMSLIVATPNLDWLLLTKRPQNLRPRMERVMREIPRNNITSAEASARCLAEAWLTTGGTIIHNIWLGTTVEDQARADERIPLLLSIPAKVRFLSCEPLLGPVNVSEIRDAEGFEYMPLVGANLPEPRIHWVICGGESGGPKARPMHPYWARSLRDQCAAAGVPFFFKQWGARGPIHNGGTGLDTDSMVYVGKAKAGRLLDGIEHNGFPKLEGGGR
jgi:protein gp37